MIVFGQRVSVYLMLSILLLSVAAFLRFHDLSQRSLWVDEAVAANNSQGSIRQTIENTRNRNSSPIVFPFILHAVQKIDRSAGSVRLPSAIFSLLAVLIILATPSVGTDQRAAFIAATVLAVSDSQIRYAQEVREYSLAVLLASVMIYGLLAFVDSEGRKRAALFASLFAAPLIQYGLVLFGFAVIGTLGLAGLLRRKPFIGDVVKCGVVLTTSGIISLLLTLRYQWRDNADSYLRDYIFQGSLLDPVSMAAFLAGKTYSLLKYLMPGEVILGVFLVAFGVCACGFTTARRISYELPLFVFALVISAIAVLFQVYPYGGTRHCLYLAPATALAFGGATIAIADSLKDREKIAWTGMVMLAVLASGMQMLQTRNPYREVQDIKSVLSYLEGPQSRGDPVYVYPGSRPALLFYGISDDRFVFGEHYPQVDLKAYRNEIGSAMERGTGRLWVILTGVPPTVEDFILSEMPRDWQLERRVDAARASLYLATKSTDR